MSLKKIHAFSKAKMENFKNADLQAAVGTQLYMQNYSLTFQRYTTFISAILTIDGDLYLL